MLMPQQSSQPRFTHSGQELIRLHLHICESWLLSNSSPWTAALSSAGPEGFSQHIWHCQHAVTTGPSPAGCTMASVTQGVRQSKTASAFPRGFISLVSEWCCRERQLFREPLQIWAWLMEECREASKEGEKTRAGLCNKIAQDSATCCSFGQDLLPPSRSERRQSLIKRL